MLVVSYYTPDYLPHAKRLRQSCIRAGLAHWIEPVEDLGQWEWNCARKPFFILRAMDCSDGPVLWVDADGEIMRPFGFGPDVNLAMHKERRPQTRDQMRCRSGTVYVAGTAGRTLVKAWMGRCKDDPNEWDQAHLWRAWQDHEKDLVVEWLGIEYCQRFDEPKSEASEDPLVVHYQASRQRKYHDRVTLAKARGKNRSTGRPWVDPVCPEFP